MSPTVEYLSRRRQPVFLATCLAAMAATSSGQTQGYALELGGASPGSVILPHHPVMNTGSVATIEVWVLAAGTPRNAMSFFVRYRASAEHKELIVWPDGSIAVLYAGSPWAPDHGVRTAPATFPFDGRWHHIAFVRHADARYAVYLDGAPVRNGGPGPCWATCNVINAQTTTGIGPYGVDAPFLIDTLRVSSTDRYSGPFTPARRWAADVATALLLQFDEGQGTTVRDAGRRSR